MKISGNVWIRVDNVTYLTEDDWNLVKSVVKEFIQVYAKGRGEVYQWSEEDGQVNIGVLTAEKGIVKLYYITIKYA